MVAIDRDARTQREAFRVTLLSEFQLCRSLLERMQIFFGTRQFYSRRGAVVLLDDTSCAISNGDYSEDGLPT